MKFFIIVFIVLNKILFSNRLSIKVDENWMRDLVSIYFDLGYMVDFQRYDR